MQSCTLEVIQQMIWMQTEVNNVTDDMVEFENQICILMRQAQMFAEGLNFSGVPNFPSFSSELQTPKNCCVTAE